MYAKKICADALYVALILAFFRVGPEVLLNSRRNDLLQVGEMLLGQTVGYRQLSFQTNHALTNRYVNLKSLDSLAMDRAFILRDQLSHLRNYGSRPNGIYAYYNEQNGQVPAASSNQGRNNTTSNSQLSSSNGEDRRSPTLETMESFHEFSTIDLSPEDMDLIEILWKQDIDLGVSREAYTPYETHIEKTKIPAELSKPTEISTLVKTTSNVNSEKIFPESKYEPIKHWDGLNYTIDNETGEYVFQDKKADDNDQNLSAENSLFNNANLDDLSLSLFSNENESDFNFPKVSSDEDTRLQEPLDDFFFNLDELFAEVDNFEDNLPKVEENNSNDEASEMYPSMEEYWQDISTTLPLSVMSGPYASGGPIIPRPIRAYPVPSSEIHLNMSSSSDLFPRVGDVFHDATAIQNATFTSRPPDLNGTYGYMPSLLGPTTLGCAVASSIATLTNDTDPMPEDSNVLNGTYGLDLPPILHPNQTSALTSSNESLISDLLMAEELQLIDSASTVHSDDGHTLTIANDNMELSSDSVTSSLSGNMSVIISLNNDNLHARSSEDTSAVEYLSKDSLYTTAKYSVHSSYMSASGYQQASGSSPNHNCTSSASSYGNQNDFNHYLQHNHSYHLPFTNYNASPKPITRDKIKYSECDDEDSHNRDEKRAKALKVPISIADIINLGIDEFNERLSKFELTEPQITLIRDIRRRGKNKVAAQNCRKRKMDQISNLQHALDFLETERMQLQSERTQLLHQRRIVKDKYSQLYQFVFQSTNHYQPMPSVFPSPMNNNNTEFNNSISDASGTIKTEDSNFNQGVRVKKKIEKKKLHFS